MFKIGTGTAPRGMIVVSVRRGVSALRLSDFLNSFESPAA
jgi:hypothetical protein